MRSTTATRRYRFLLVVLAAALSLGPLTGNAAGANELATATANDLADIEAAITADVSADGVAMSDRLYGIFYEDINHAADGGLYAELVQNRSFEFDPIDNSSYHGLTAWERVNRGGAAGEIAVATADPLNDKNLNYLRLTITASGTTEQAGVAVRNSGFNTGIHVEAGKRYDFSFWARRSGTADIPVRVAVEDAASRTVYGTAETTVTTDAWRKYEGVLTASGTTTTGRLAVIVGGAPPAGTIVDFDMVSLFPQDTFKGRKNGMRKDIAEMIAALNPSFLRFPGGCLVNAGSFEPFPIRNRLFNWKDTIGPIEERPTNRNFWGYNETYGIGYLEYFQFAQDLGAEPLPVVPVGVNGCGLHDVNRLTTPEQLAPWVEDTLDLIEFANGDPDTEWGAKRAALGHPEPFGLEFVALGNEEYDPQFYENYPYFANAIRAAYPEIKVVSNTGTTSAGAVFDRSWEFAREQGADLVDEHYYNSHAWFLANSHRYDNYDRNGPHVFVGEYAARVGQFDNTFYSGLVEAAYTTGIERNSDVVEMASYAPLLANASYVNWSPDLIWFDNHRVYGSPSYHVQRLFSENRGDTVIPSALQADPSVDDITGGIGVATWNTQACYDNVKVTAEDGTVLFADDFSAGADQWTPSGPTGAPRGTWAVTDGEYCQSQIISDARSIAGDTDWSNYTLELTARKVGGGEGFLIMFGARDTGNYYWWNLGGWNNTMSGVEKSVNGGKSVAAGSEHTIETGRTYQIKVTVDGRHITTWLDGEKVNDFTDYTGNEPEIVGGVGVATWNTQACYDNVQVTGADGTELFSDDFSAGADQWTPTGPAGTPRGIWNVTNGEYCQTQFITDARSIAGDTDWSNYTLELTARKLGGAEGFLIMFGARDTGNYYWWNLGGWGNTTSAIEKAVNGGKSTIAGSEHTIETGRTYQIKITVDGRHITTWLDGEKVNDFIDRPSLEPLYQVITRDETTGDVVLKVVNAQPTAIRTAVDLGPRRLSDTGTVTTMTADNMTDRNSLDDPTNVVPVATEVSRLGNQFVYDFPANSITFIRLNDARAETALEATVAPSSVPIHAFATVVGWLPGVTGEVRPTGTVTVTSADGTELGTADLGPELAVPITVWASDVGVGTHELTVSYSGDANFKPSSAAVTLTVTEQPGRSDGQEGSQP